MNLKTSTALITGGASGLGAAAVRQFAASGANVNTASVAAFDTLQTAVD